MDLDYKALALAIVSTPKVFICSQSRAPSSIVVLLLMVISISFVTRYTW